MPHTLLIHSRMLNTEANYNFLKHGKQRSSLRISFRYDPVDALPRCKSAKGTLRYAHLSGRSTP